MKSPIEAILFPTAFYLLFALFLARTIPAIRKPAARLSWLAAGAGACGVFMLGSVVPLQSIDGVMGGRNVSYLLQNLFATVAFWMLTQTTIRRGGLSARNWLPLVGIVCAFTVPFLFISREGTSPTFTHDRVDQIAMLLCTGIYLAGLIFMCAHLLRAIRHRSSRAYWPFTLGAWMVILGCACEIAFMTLDHFNAATTEDLDVGYFFFTPLFFPGVMFIVAGVGSFAVRRRIRDRNVDELAAGLSAILTRIGVSMPELDLGESTSHARLLRILGLDVEIRDRVAIRQLKLDESERVLLERAEKLLEMQLTVPMRAELWSTSATPSEPEYATRTPDLL